MVEKYIPTDHEAHSRTSRDLYAQAVEELVMPAPATRLPGFDKFNTVTGGFRPREFSILCGATGTGKTTLLANISAGLVRGKIPHFVASVETGATDFVKRVLSVFASKDLNDGEAVPVEILKRIHAQHGHELQSDYLHLSLYDNRFSVTTLISDIAWHVKTHGVKLAIVDNLNFFMEVTSAQNQVVEMDRVVHELIIFCKRVDVHIVMVMHPKKTDGTARVESEFDVKGSSTAVQEAHNVFLFNRAHPQRVEAGVCRTNDRELKISKMRRRGRYVGSTLILNSFDSVSYKEGAIL